MQFGQPGFTNYGQPFLFNTPLPSYSGFPVIVGEGNVTSYISPDGSIQFLFLPTASCMPYQWNPHIDIPNSFYPTNTGAWVIRSVFNPFQQAVFNSPCSATFDKHVKPLSFPNLHCPQVPPNPFELKFHYDSCTSTSDIHYFYPRLRQCNWYCPPQYNAEVQVDTVIPSNVTKHDKKSSNIVFNTNASKKVNTSQVECMCEDSYSNSSVSSMSVEQSSDKGIKKSKKHKKKQRKQKPKKKKHKKSDIQCGCPKMHEDKSVVTYADKASSAIRTGQETQTHNCTSKAVIPMRIVSSTIINRKHVNPTVSVTMTETNCTTCASTSESGTE